MFFVSDLSGVQYYRFRIFFFVFFFFYENNYMTIYSLQCFILIFTYNLSISFHRSKIKYSYTEVFYVILQILNHSIYR